MNKSFDFDIQPNTRQVVGKIHPGEETEVNFSIRNTGDGLKRAEVILEPVNYKMGKALPRDDGLNGRDLRQTHEPPADDRLIELASWLKLDSSPEYDYEPQSQQHYTVKIKVPDGVNIGIYIFRLLLVGHDDPDNEYQQSEEVSFEVIARPVKSRPFVIGGIAILVLIAVGVFIAMRVRGSSTAMKAELIPPDEKGITVGQPAEYQIKLQNNFEETVAESVVMEYTFPDGVLGAWASVDWTGNAKDASHGFSICGSTSEMLRCVFEKIEPKETATLTIYVLPGPPDPDQAVSAPAAAETSTPTGTPTAQTMQIDNTGHFTLRWVENGEAREDLVLREKDLKLTVNPVDAEETPVSGAAIPAVDIATVGLPVKISLIGWSNNDKDETVFLEYALPQGMRFFGEIPEDCIHQSGNYSTLNCPAKSKVPIYIQVVPLQPSTGYDQVLRGSTTKQGNYEYLGNTPVLKAAVRQLSFNGVDEWAQLDYSGLPDTKEFTVEMWVNPYSLEDGQALIGTHRHSQGDASVSNHFLIGYYNGYLNVNVLGECRNLDIKPNMGPASPAEEFTGKTVEDAIQQGLQELSLKREQVQIEILNEGEGGLNWLGFVLKPPIDAQVRLSPKVQTISSNQPFHLAVVVKGDPNNNEREVTVYMDGKQLETTINPCCSDCKVEPWENPADDEVDLNWIIGQDWDPDGSNIVSSDFFHGAISDIRIFNGALTEKEVQEDMYLPPSIFASDNAEPGARLELIGWWPLAQPRKPASSEQLTCILPKIGELVKGETATDAACLLVDLGLAHRNGARSGGAWGNRNTAFGNALAFNGSSVLFLDSSFGNDIFLRPAKTPFAATSTSSLNPNDGTEEPSEPDGVPVTLSAWIFIDAIPSQPQTILHASFTPDDGGRVIFGLSINENGHMQVVYDDNAVLTVVEDEKRMPAGQWVHYAAVFWFDKANGALSVEASAQSEGEPNSEVYLLLFRNGEQVKAPPMSYEKEEQGTIDYYGFSLGGLKTPEDNEILQGFTGRIDEIRIWNRALYKPIGNTSRISTEINFWRRLPGVAFDESVYWSFDDQVFSGTQTLGLCQSNACAPIFLSVTGPLWIPNELSIDYSE